ncbi:MAG: PEP-CTERM sorting domain-containing protein [Myxococcota bacterium]
MPRPVLPFRCRLTLLTLAGFLALGPLHATGARAALITIEFQGTVTGATLDLGALLSGGEAISGTLVLDDSLAGVFTPTPNPDFLRAEVLYAGAVVSSEVELLGDTVSGTGGDVELFDSTGALSGDDSYEVTGALSAGDIMGVAPASIFWNTAYDMSGFGVADGDPLFAPPILDPFSFHQFTLTSATGGIAFGPVDSFQLVSVPEPGSAMFGLMGLGLAGLARRRARALERAPGA